MTQFFLAISVFIISQASEIAPRIRVLFLGDSITAGYGLKPDQAYPELVAELLQKERLRIAPINGGVSGDTTAAGARRLDWQLKSSPDLVVIALGGNDMLRGIPPSATRKNLAGMIQKLQHKNIPVALLGMKASSSLGRDFEEEFNRIYKSLGEEFKIPVLEFFIEKVALRSDLNLHDRIHPNVEGQKLIAQDVAEFLKPILQDLESKKDVRK